MIRHRQICIPLCVLTAGLWLCACDEGPSSSREGGPSLRDAGGEMQVFDISFCVPRCEGKACGGDDGCGGTCKVGLCALGQRCDDGICRCDQSSCPEGCCRDDACFPGAADSHCGTGGGPCVDCLAQNQACGADQSCFACQPQCAGKSCGAPNGCDGICSTGSCPSGQICTGGICVCNASSCSTGCCRDNLCYPGKEDSHCGTGGALCADCQLAEQQCEADQICRTCQPQCATAACGAPDGCGGVCQTGSCAGGQACVSGACLCNGASCPNGCCEGTLCHGGDADALCGGGGSACTNCALANQSCIDKACLDCSTWRVGPIAANLQDAAVDTDGRIYATGSAATGIQLLRIDACGALEQHHSWGLTSLVTKRASKTIAIVGDDLWVAGAAELKTDPNNGFYTRFGKMPLVAKMDKGIWGSSGSDEIWSMVWTGDAFFMSGASNYDVNAAAWSVKADASGTACGTRVFASGAGNGRRARLDPSGSYVYYTGVQEGAAFVTRYGVGDCAITPCSPCQAPWTMTFQVDGLTTEGRDVLVVGSSLYVAGFYVIDAANSGGFVAKIDVATQSVSQIFRWSPTAKFDILQALAFDGTIVYAAGGRDLEADTSGGSAAVLALSPTLVQQWGRAPGEPRLYWDVELAGTDGLILTGGSTTQGYVRRCLRSGVCP